ncbi:MAG TPA: hypothetical protein EYP30_05425 [Archaeoglobaceae archaeon]|nr:hypothetical protein [Archaeoglobaceae archaeon]
MTKIYYRVLQTDGDVIKKLKCYDGLVIEAPILEQYTNFAVSLVSTIERPFFIDPTHKLVLRDLEHVAEKEWLIKVMEAYEISECLQEGEISFEMLWEKLDSFVSAVISYQRERLGKSSGGLELFGVVPRLEPQIILTPYFLIDGIDSESYKLNLEMIKESVALKGKEKLYAVMALERYLISRDLNKLISDFAVEGLDGFCIWISDFREYDEDARMLEKYVEFFKRLSEIGKPVINLYGGTFSIFIGKLGFIDGIVQGIGYGEYRNPFVHATGGYPKRYYIPKLHRSVPIFLAQELLATVPELKCDCEFCAGADILKTREKEVRADSLKKHYMLGRWKEKKADFDELYKDLQETIQLLNKSGMLDRYWDQLRHLENWSKVLEGFSR